MSASAIRRWVNVQLDTHRTVVNPAPDEPIQKGKGGAIDLRLIIAVAPPTPTQPDQRSKGAGT